MIRPNIVCCTWKDAYLTLIDGDRVIGYYKDFIPHETCPLAIKIDYHSDDPMNSSIATLPLAAVPRDAADYYPLGYQYEADYSYQEAINALEELIKTVIPHWKIVVKDSNNKILWETVRYDDIDGATNEIMWLIGRLGQSYPSLPTVEDYWAPVRAGKSIELLLPDGDTQVYNMKGECLFIRPAQSPIDPVSAKIEAAFKHTQEAHPECMCNVCTLGFDQWLFTQHPGEY